MSKKKIVCIIVILKWEYGPSLLILLKLFKNANTGLVILMFYLKNESSIQRRDKRISKEV